MEREDFKEILMLGETTGNDTLDALIEQKAIIEEAIETIGQLLRDPDINPSIRQQAESYWLAHIDAALGSDRYIGGSMVTMEETLMEIYDDVHTGPDNGSFDESVAPRSIVDVYVKKQSR